MEGLSESWDLKRFGLWLEDAQFHTAFKNTQRNVMLYNSEIS